MNDSMDWNKLLSRKRLAKPPGDPRLPHRSAFEIDADRITFSTSFRRLQDKQQVYGIGGSDYVRSRLTHSLEVSRVGRSLGAWVGREVLSRSKREVDASPFDFGQIVAAAALAHDLGTPCFAHSGEDIISDWFVHGEMGRRIAAGLPAEVRAEVSRFEGNAQGFRVLARLQGWRAQGGLQLTVATLAAYSKYPWRLDEREEANPRARRGKYGFFASEQEAFAEVARETGLLPVREGLEWCRHPLAYLVEAADDICYRIVDIEDAVKMHLLQFDEAEELLAPLAEPMADEYRPIQDLDRKLIYLRARAIDRLVSDAAAAFLECYDGIMRGEYVPDLISFSPCRGNLALIEQVSRARIYNHERRYETDIIAGRAIWQLLDNYARALMEWEAGGEDERLSRKARSLIGSMPDHQHIPRDREGWVRVLLDYIAGMTDRFAMRQAELVGG